MKKNQEGFTLIEILVALTIIGVLLTFVAPIVFNRPDQARSLKVKNDFMAINTAYNLYKLDNGSFPNPSEGLSALEIEKETGQGYLKTIPLDPWGIPYRVIENDKSEIVIVSAGPDKKFSNSELSDDIFSEPIQ